MPWYEIEAIYGFEDQPNEDRNDELEALNGAIRHAQNGAESVIVWQHWNDAAGDLRSRALWNFSPSDGWSNSPEAI